jgi:hypothetical protein
MKKACLAVTALLCLCALPNQAEAKIFHHPFLHRIFHSPLVHQAVDTGLSHLLPILSDATNQLRVQPNAKIMVDASVSANIKAGQKNVADAKANLTEARGYLDDLLKSKKNSDLFPTKKAAAGSSSGGASDDRPELSD